MRFVAFLRGINLGKLNRLPMTDLRACCLGLGLREVSTHLQTGNVIYESDEAGETVARQLEAAIARLECTNVTVMVRSLPELLELRAENPFATAPLEHQRHYVTLLREASPRVLPQRNAKGDLEIVRATPLAVFSRVHHPSNASPNAFVEAKLKVSATTRFANVMDEVIAKALG